MANTIGHEDPVKINQSKFAGQRANVRALGDAVIVRPLRDTEKTAGGLWKPDTARARSELMEGEVLSIGAGVIDKDGEIRRPINLEVGQRVLFYRIRGQRCWGDWPTAEDELRVLPFREVVAVLEDGARLNE